MPNFTAKSPGSRKKCSLKPCAVLNGTVWSIEKFIQLFRQGLNTPSHFSAGRSSSRCGAFAGGQRNIWANCRLIARARRQRQQTKFSQVELPPHRSIANWFYVREDEYRSAANFSTFAGLCGRPTCSNDLERARPVRARQKNSRQERCNHR